MDPKHVSLNANRHCCRRFFNGLFRIASPCFPYCSLSLPTLLNRSHACISTDTHARNICELCWLIYTTPKNHRIKLANTERLMQINIIYHSGICDFLGLFAFVVILFVLIFICRYLTLQFPIFIDVCQYFSSLNELHTEIWFGFIFHSSPIRVDSFSGSLCALSQLFIICFVSLFLSIFHSHEIIGDFSVSFTERKCSHHEAYVGKNEEEKEKQTNNSNKKYESKVPK